jgi:hypothetical protein
LGRETGPIRVRIFGGPGSVDGLELAVPLDSLIYTFSL